MDTAYIPRISICLNRTAHSREGPHGGFAAVQAATYDLSKITAGLGIEFDLRVNTYKPYPCGIVNHPTIDGAIQLHDTYAVDPQSIGRDVTVLFTGAVSTMRYAMVVRAGLFALSTALTTNV